MIKQISIMSLATVMLFGCATATKVNQAEINKTENAIASIVFDENIENYDFSNIEEIVGDFEIISSEDIEEYLKGKGE